MQGGCKVFSLLIRSTRLKYGSLLTPSWQYRRFYGLDLPTSSTITGMRGAAGGRQPTAAKPHCTVTNIISFSFMLKAVRLSTMLQKHNTCTSMSPPNSRTTIIPGGATNAGQKGVGKLSHTPSTPERRTNGRQRDQKHN